jgi:uncharacterized protein with HEPN domain
MAAHDDIARLRHMLDHAREAVELIGNRNRASIIADRVLTLALVRLLEIVGEAAARVSQPTRSQCATIPWQQIVGLRNRLIHGYDAVDMEVFWQILSSDLPPLIIELEHVLGGAAGKR